MERPLSLSLPQGSQHSVQNLFSLLDTCIIKKNPKQSTQSLAVEQLHIFQTECGPCSIYFYQQMTEFSCIWNNDELWLTFQWWNDCEQKFWSNFVTFSSLFLRWEEVNTPQRRPGHGPAKLLFSWKCPHTKGQWVTCLQKCLGKHFSQIWLEIPGKCFRHHREDTMAMSMLRNYLTHWLLPLEIAGGLQEQHGKLNVEKLPVSPR